MAPKKKLAHSYLVSIYYLLFFLRLDTENCISDAMQIITDSSENAVMMTSNSSSFFDLMLASTPSCSGSQITEIENDDPENCNNTSLVPVKKSYTRKKMNAPKFRKFKVSRIFM